MFGLNVTQRLAVVTSGRQSSTWASPRVRLGGELVQCRVWNGCLPMQRGAGLRTLRRSRRWAVVQHHVDEDEDEEEGDESQTSRWRAVRSLSRRRSALSQWDREQLALERRLQLAERKIVELAVDLAQREAQRIQASDRRFLDEQQQQDWRTCGPFEYLGVYVASEPPPRLHSQPGESSPWPVLLAVTGLNLLVLLVMHWCGQPGQPDFLVDVVMEQLVGSRANLEQGRWWTLLTCTFSHSDWGHFSGNMFALWLLGYRVAQSLGAARFLLMYLTTGTLATLAEIYAFDYFYQLIGPSTTSNNNNNDDEEKKKTEPVEQPPRLIVGASGSVMAVTAAAAMLFPVDRIRPVPGMPSLAIAIPISVGMYMAGDVSGVLHHDSGIAHYAHLSGSLLGLLFTAVYWKTSKRIPPNTPLPLIGGTRQAASANSSSSSFRLQAL